MEIRLVPVSELKPYRKNAKKHPKTQIDAEAYTGEKAIKLN